MKFEKQQVRNSHTNKIASKTVYDVEQSTDENTSTLKQGKVKYGKHEIKVYRDTSLFERWCNY